MVTLAFTILLGRYFVFGLGEDAIDRSRQHINSTLAGSKTPQLSFAVEKIIGRYISLFVLKSVAQLVLVINCAGLGDSIVRYGLTDCLYVGVRFVTRHMHRDHTQPFILALFTPG